MEGPHTLVRSNGSGHRSHCQPVQDKATVTPAGESLAPLIDGVVVRSAVTQVDERGTLCESIIPTGACMKPH